MVSSVFHPYVLLFLKSRSARCDLQWVPDFKDISHIDDMWSYVSEFPSPSIPQPGSSTKASTSQPTSALAEEDEDLLNVFQNVQIVKKARPTGLEVFSTIESADQATKRPTWSPNLESHPPPESSPFLKPDFNGSSPPEPRIKGILRKPTERFPEDVDASKSDVAPRKLLKPKGIPPGAKWTKIDRRLVNPQALEEKRERFEERQDCVIVLRVLTKDEIQGYSDRTKEIREAQARVSESVISEELRNDEDSNQEGSWMGTDDSRRRENDGHQVTMNNVDNPSDRNDRDPSPDSPNRPWRVDDTSFSYTDAAGMYRDTEPGWRPRRGSVDRGSRRPSSGIEHLGLEPGIRGHRFQGWKSKVT